MAKKNRETEPFVWNFGELDKARLRRGDSIEMACAAIRVSRSTWDNWRRGDTQPLRSALRLVQEYVAGPQ